MESDIDKNEQPKARRKQEEFYLSQRLLRSISSREMKCEI